VDVTVLAPGRTTAIGSLPHVDPAAAAAFVVDELPELPAAPSLPRRDPRESMVAQAAWGMPGVTVSADGTLSLASTRLEVDAGLADADLQDEPWGSLRAFLSAVPPRTPVKLQLTGPITLALALRRAGAPRPRAFAAAANAVTQRVRHVVDAVADRVPRSPLVVFLDEPGLAALDDELSPTAVTDVLRRALAAVGPGIVTGVHCCGQAAWVTILDAEPDVLSLPVDMAGRLRPGDLRGHLDRGGWVAWGAVPTSGPLPGDVDALWRRMAERWHDLDAGGCDPVLLRRRVLVTPACGLAHHTVEQAAAVLGLTRALGARVAEGVSIA
jgi:methionine synthase II (cobalamin-independent)